MDYILKIYPFQIFQVCDNDIMVVKKKVLVFRRCMLKGWRVIMA